MTRVAAVLVTHNARAWITETLASIASQTRPADTIVVIDDHSIDGTPDIVREAVGGTAVLAPATTQASDRITRIAQNFQQGLRMADADIVVLGDHDDVWLPHRIAHQLNLLETYANAGMVASDGTLIDAAGASIPGTLREHFPVPQGFGSLTPPEQMRTALRNLIATGGASALRRAAFADLSIPAGWLHDRWWSLVATAREGMLIDDEAVIAYRISAHQEVGLEQGNLTKSAFGRVTSALASAGPSARKLRDIRESLAPVATPVTRPELQGSRLLRNLL